ncbi:MAG: hypothetical protein V2A79_13105 [Planctomycetota bacterium]
MMLTGSWSGPGTTTQPSGRYEIVERSLAQVWQDWHARGPIGPAQWLLFATVVIVTACVALTAWLYLVGLHRTGAAWPSYQLAFRAVASCGGLAGILIAALGTFSALIYHHELRRLATSGPSRGIPMALVSVIYVGYPVALWLLVVWIGRAVRGAHAPSSDPDPPPRCEGCGYDLTHVPSNGLCPECGQEAEWSLAPELGRPGCPWEWKTTLQNWVFTSWEAVVHPSRFYRALKLRTPNGSLQRFARWHYLAVAVLTSAWVLVALLVEGAAGEFIPALSGAALFGTLLLGWGVHRAIAALSITWWLAQKALPDFAWARKVVAYESAFLWAPFLYNLALGTSFLIFDDWMTSLIGSRLMYSLTGVPPEVAVILFGNAALGIAWLWRYRLALRAIRWSNF